MKRLEVKPGLFRGQVQKALDISENQIKLILKLGVLEIECHEPIEIANGCIVNARKFNKECVDRLRANKEELESLLETSHVETKKWTAYNDVADTTIDNIDLTGKSVCLTGTFTRVRSELEKMLTEKGVIVKKGVTKKLDYLISGVDGGSKVVKAQSLNIPILGEIALENFLGIRYDYGEFDGTELSEEELIF